MGGDDKPYDEEPFDADVEADEASDPKKYIQQLSGKLGQSLRKYEKEMGQPDLELEKFAINSVVSASNTAEMDEEDQKDIIDKIKSSGLENDIAEPDAEDAEVDADAVGAELPEPEGEEFGDEPELGEVAIMELGGGPPEDREYDAMQTYHDRQANAGTKSNYHVSVDKKGNFKVGEPEKRFPSGKIVNGERVSDDKWGKTEQVSEEISIFEQRLRSKLNENLKYPTREVRSERGYLGVTVWGDSGSVSLDIYSKQNNPYGGSPWSKIQSGGGVRPEELTKEYIMREVGARYKNPESFVGEIDEVLSKLNDGYEQMMQDMNPEIAEPEVKPKRKEEQAPKRVRETDLPYRKPVRETKTKPKATI